MLRKIISLFKERKIISLTDLALHFKVDKSAMEGMMLQLTQKKLIEHMHSECFSCSSNCKTCSFADDKEYYRIIERT